MSLFNAIFNSVPSSTPAPAATVLGGVDTNAGALWLSTPESAGWVPVSLGVGKGHALAQTGATASVLTFVVPISGLYRIDAIVDQAPATNGTPGAVQYAYTNADSGSAVAAASFTTPAGTTGIGQGQTGTVIVNALGGSSIVVSALAPTTLTQNVRARVEFLG